MLFAVFKQLQTFSMVISQEFLPSDTRKCKGQKRSQRERGGKLQRKINIGGTERRAFGSEKSTGKTKRRTFSRLDCFKDKQESIRVTGVGSRPGLPKILITASAQLSFCNSKDFISIFFIRKHKGRNLLVARFYGRST